jgi:hypothetical protein
MLVFRFVDPIRFRPVRLMLRYCTLGRLRSQLSLHDRGERHNHVVFF